MSFFSKVKSIASKGMKVLSDVKTAAVEYATAPSTSSIAYSTLPPFKEIIQLAQQVLEIIDSLSQNDPYSMDSDRKLNDSKIRLYIGRIIYLLQVESNNESLSSHNEDSEPSSPCIDMFVSSNFLAALITRGLADKPRGCLPLVLCVIADILRNVSYPLLPLQSIYKPVSKLISNAMRYDAVHNNANLICSGGVYNKNEYSAYKRRIEIALNVLLSVIWRKISENPPILEYFIVSDSTRSERKKLGGKEQMMSRPVKLTVQIDILTALVTTLLKPKTSSFAQESLYISLYMRSSTITHFVVNHTNLLLALVNEVCKRYVAAVDFMIKSNTTTGGKAGTSSGAGGIAMTPSARFSSPQSRNTDPAVAAGSNSLVNAVESFVSIFKLCVAVYSLLLNNINREIILQSSSNGDASAVAAARAAGQLILDNFSGYFLFGTLHYSLTASSDVQLLSAYALLRRILLELSTCEEMNGETDGPDEYSLLHVTTHFLCGQFLRAQAATVGEPEVPTEEALLSGDAEAEDGKGVIGSSSSVSKSSPVDYLSTFLTRCSSVNKPLSVSAVQLVSVLLSLSALPTTINACCNRSRVGPDASSSSTAAPTTTTVSMMMAGRAESVDRIINAYVANLLPNIYQTYSTDAATASPAPSAAPAATPARQPNPATAVVSPTSAASITPPGPAAGTAATQSAKMRVGAFNRYVDIAANHILYRLSGHLTDILDHSETSGRASLFPALIDSAVGSGSRGGTTLLSSHNTVYEMLLRKLSSFMTLKTDEQIALSGLLHQYMGVLCILVITSTDSAASVLNGGVNAKSCFGQIVEILQNLDVLFNTMRNHVTKLANSSNKLAAMKKLLQNSALQRIDDHNEKRRQVAAASSASFSNSVGYSGIVGDESGEVHAKNLNRINSMISMGGGSSHGAGGSANSSSHGPASSSAVGASGGGSGVRRVSSMYGNASAGNSGSNTPTTSSHGGIGVAGSSSSNASRSVNSSSGGSAPYVAQQSAEYKYLEKEPPQVKQILETANYILELRAELRAFVFAVQILKSQFIHVRTLQQREEDNLFEGVVLDQQRSHENGAEGEPLDEESISDLADIEELRQMQAQISPPTSGSGESSGATVIRPGTKRLTYWSNIDGRETDFMQEYEALNITLEELICHLLPDANEILSEQFPGYEWSFALTCAGVVLVLAIEQIVLVINLDEPKEKKDTVYTNVHPSYQGVATGSATECGDECALTACAHVQPTSVVFQRDDHSHVFNSHTQFEHNHNSQYGDDHGHRSISHSSAGHDHRSASHDHSSCQSHDHDHGHEHGHAHNHGHDCGSSHPAPSSSVSAYSAASVMPVSGPPPAFQRLMSHDHAEHDHILGNVLNSNGLQTLITAYVLEISIAVHSVIIGVDLGMLSDPSDNVTVITLLVALCFHQFIEGVGLGSAIQASRGSLGDAKVIGFVLIFSLTMSIGVVIGIATSSDQPSAAQDTAKGVANSFATGSLLYISLSEMVASYFGASDLKKRPKLRLAMLASFSLGVLIMAIIANWA